MAGRGSRCCRLGQSRGWSVLKRDSLYRNAAQLSDSGAEYWSRLKQFRLKTVQKVC